MIRKRRKQFWNSKLVILSTLWKVFHPWTYRTIQNSECFSWRHVMSWTSQGNILCKSCMWYVTAFVKNMPKLEWFKKIRKLHKLEQFTTTNWCYEVHLHHPNKCNIHKLSYVMLGFLTHVLISRRAWCSIIENKWKQVICHDFRRLIELPSSGHFICPSKVTKLEAQKLKTEG